MSLLGSGSVHMVGRLAKPLAAQPGSKPGGAQQICQRCLQQGHWTYQCTAPAATYIPRPSRTKQLKNPKVRQRFLDASELPELRSAKQIEADEKREAQEAKEAKRKRKEKRCQQSSSSSSSDSDSETSSSSSGSDTSSSSSDSGSSSSSDSDSGSSSGTSSSSDGSSSSGSESSGTSSSSDSEDFATSDEGRRRRKRKGSKTSPPAQKHSNGAACRSRRSASPDARAKRLKRGRSESPPAAHDGGKERHRQARSRSQERVGRAGKDEHADVGGGLRRGTPSPGRWVGSDHELDEDMHRAAGGRERRGEYRRAGSGRRRTKVVSMVRQASPAGLELQRSGGERARGADRHEREEPRGRRGGSRERGPVRRTRSPSESS